MDTDGKGAVDAGHGLATVACCGFVKVDADKGSKGAACLDKLDARRDCGAVAVLRKHDDDKVVQVRRRVSVRVTTGGLPLRTATCFFSGAQYARAPLALALLLAHQLPSQLDTPSPTRRTRAARPHAPLLHAHPCMPLPWPN